MRDLIHRYENNKKPAKRTAEEIQAASWDNHHILREAPSLVAYGIKHGLLRLPKFKPQILNDNEETDSDV